MLVSITYKDKLLCETQYSYVLNPKSQLKMYFAIKRLQNKRLRNLLQITITKTILYRQVQVL